VSANLTLQADFVRLS